uniref:Thioredoxin domain-containing protein n=2 Tax=Plectus sambesii TaxID=2011161 RepID=A0A914WCH2_9BILA
MAVESIFRRLIRLEKSLYIPFIFLLSFCFHIPLVSSAVVALDKSNVDSILGGQLVFVNFYADWCRFSQQLKPIFEAASEKFKDQPANKIVWASVDSDRQPEIAQKYHVNKYPTLKLFRNGEMAKKEYRGQRSVEALSEFMQKHLDGNIQGFVSVDDMEARIDKKRRNVIGYFTAANGPEFENFQSVAALLREECTFWLGVGDAFKQQTLGGNNVAFRPPETHEDQVFSGTLGDLNYVKQWLTDKCIPLVREITFENAEELTEEGLPFVILFRDPSDTEADKMYTEQVVRELHDQKTSVNCLVADGKKFAHPLHHLGKSEKDLPLLAIDSFRHMYLFPDMTQITVPGKLRQFILDLHSGKLHREFHHGPDPTTPDQQLGAQAPGQQPNQGGQQTDPPESVFNKLKPSDNRYTLLEKQEL